MKIELIQFTKMKSGQMNQIKLECFDWLFMMCGIFMINMQ